MHCSIEKELTQLAEAHKSKKAKKYAKTLFDLQGFLAHHIQGKKNIKILDVGAAYGTLTAYLAWQPGFEVYATDQENLADKGWWDKYNIHFAINNIEQEDLPWGDFDLILFTEVIEHLNYSPFPVVERLYKALKPGGSIICTTPMKEAQGIIHPIEGKFHNYGHYKDIPLPWNGYEFLDDHHYFYGRQELVQLFHEAGFNVKDAYTIRAGTTHYLWAEK